MIYQFRPDAPIPKGATPTGVAKERDKIKRVYGKATITNSVAAVLGAPGKYPNLRAFGPADAETAFRQAIADGIRTAYASVVVRRTGVNERAEPRYVRVIHSVRDDDGDLVYEPIDVIRKSPSETKYLIAQLKRDAALFAAKVQDVIAEIEEAI